MSIVKQTFKRLHYLGFVENKEELWHLTENGKNLVPYKDCFLSAAAIMWSDNRIAWKNLTNIICDGKDKHHDLFKSNMRSGATPGRRETC